MWLIRKKKKSSTDYTDLENTDYTDNRCNQCFHKPISAISDEGFTLIELMVAASIIGLIGLTILTTFGSGFHVYERVQTFGGVQADVLLSLEEIEKNLKNLFPFSTIGFEGDAQSIAFPTIIETIETVDAEEVVTSSVGKIAYYLDDAGDDTKALMSGWKDYSQAVAKIGAAESRKDTLALIENIGFSYFLFDEENQTYSWTNSWDTQEENLPRGVKIEVTFQDGDRNVQLVRTVFIPSMRETPK